MTLKLFECKYTVVIIEDVEIDELEEVDDGGSDDGYDCSNDSVVEVKVSVIGWEVTVRYFRDNVSL